MRPGSASRRCSMARSFTLIERAAGRAAPALRFIAQMSLSREKTMRVALRFVFAAGLTIGALAPAAAQPAAGEASNQQATRAHTIPASQLRFYCFSGPFAYSIGAVTCL